MQEIHYLMYSVMHIGTLHHLYDSTTANGSNRARFDKKHAFYTSAIWVMGNHIKLGTRRYHHGN